MLLFHDLAFPTFASGRVTCVRPNTKTMQALAFWFLRPKMGCPGLWVSNFRPGLDRSTAIIMSGNFRTSRDLASFRRPFNGRYFF